MKKGAVAGGGVDSSNVGSMDSQEDERRKLRQQQVMLHEQLVSHRESLLEVGSGLLTQLRDANNQQFEKYT